MSKYFADVMEDIEAERERQLKKWGPQSHRDDFWYVIEGEEFGEVGRAIFEGDRQSDFDQHLYDEVIQVAAVAVAWAEDMQARRGQ